MRAEGLARGRGPRVWSLHVFGVGSQQTGSRVCRSHEEGGAARPGEEGTRLSSPLAPVLQILLQESER